MLMGVLSSIGEAIVTVMVTGRAGYVGSHAVLALGDPPPLRVGTTPRQP